MTEQLSIIDLVLNASPMVQAVMALLMVGSVVSWVMIFQKGFMLSAVRRESTEFENEFWSGNDLQELYMSIDGAEEAPIGMKSIFVAGFKEFSRLRRDESDLDRIMQNVQRAMRVSLFREEERLETNLTFLATVGSISPYIGLFGTVWGIFGALPGASWPFWGRSKSIFFHTWVQDRLQKAFWIHLGSILGRFWEGLWGSLLGTSWAARVALRPLLWVSLASFGGRSSSRRH